MLFNINKKCLALLVISKLIAKMCLMANLLVWFQNYNFLAQCETSERSTVSCALFLCRSLSNDSDHLQRAERAAIARARAVCWRSGAQQRCGMKLSHKTKVSCCCRASVCGDDGVNHICCCERVWRLQGWAPLFKRERAGERAKRDVRSAAMFRGSHIAW